MAGSLSGRHLAVNDRDRATGVPTRGGFPGDRSLPYKLHRISPLSPPWTRCLLVAFPSWRCQSFGPEGRSPSGPTPSPRDSTSSRPSTEAASPWSRHERGLDGEELGGPTPQDRPRQQQRSRRSTGSPRAGSEGDGRFATGGRLGQTSGDPRRHGRDGPTSQSQTSEQTAPNPGTSWRGPLRGDGRPDERSDSERTVTGAPGEPVDDRE
jgi:hypothetical protein